MLLLSPPFSFLNQQISNLKQIQLCLFYVRFLDITTESKLYFICVCVLRKNAVSPITHGHCLIHLDTLFFIWFIAKVKYNEGDGIYRLTIGDV